MISFRSYLGIIAKGTILKFIFVGSEAVLLLIISEKMLNSFNVVTQTKA